MPGDLREFSVPSGGNPFTIVAGPDGALWFTEVNANRIGRITTAGAITEFAAGGNPGGIAAGADGAIWFTEIAGNSIARTTGASVSEFAIPAAGSVPHAIAAGPDGALW